MKHKNKNITKVLMAVIFNSSHISLLSVLIWSINNLPFEMCFFINIISLVPKLPFWNACQLAPSKVLLVIESEPQVRKQFCSQRGLWEQVFKQKSFVSSCLRGKKTHLKFNL